MKDVSRHKEEQENGAEKRKSVNMESYTDDDDEQLHKQHLKSRRLMLFNKLIDACKQKNLIAIRSLVGERPEVVNLRDKYNRSLLHYAVISLVNKENNRNNEEEEEEQESTENNLQCFNYIANLCDEKLFLKQDLDGLSILHLAVISSNLPLVRKILFHGNINKTSLVRILDNERHSPLHWAVITNQLRCVKWLIESGGVGLAHEPDLNHSTPLHYATQTRDYPKYRRQLRRMLSNVVSSKSCSIGSFSKNDQLEELENNQPPPEEAQDVKHRATRKRGVGDDDDGLEILEFLVELEGINLECIDKDRRTPLLWAASSGNKDALLVLIKHGANLFSYDVNRLTALHCAASHGYTDCLECLLTRASDLPEVNPNQLQQLNVADNLNCTPLFYAILSGNIDCLELLLDRGAEKDWQDVKGRTAAHFAALKGQLNSLKLLQERNANLWLPNKQGDLPLHYAVKSGRKQVVRWLLEHSPYDNSVNAINNFGRAPIHIAILKDNLQMTEYLINSGANLNQLVKIRSSKKLDSASENPEELKLVNGSSMHQTKLGNQYHYETAMDMARNLNRKSCLELLLDKKAKFAADVIAHRELVQQNDGSNMIAESTLKSKRGNLKSLFDLETIEGPSPIGFETSCSSNESPNMEHHPLKSGMPKLSGPTRTAMLPQTDSTGSSALSHNSETSIRGIKQTLGHQSSSDVTRTPPNLKGSSRPLGKLREPQDTSENHLHQEVEGGHNSLKKDNRDDEDDPKRPYKGGISYNNQHMNASIKCKLYDCNHSGSNKSFPPDGTFVSSKEARSYRSVPSNLGGGQEIITNVNVYTTSPICQHCVDSNRKSIEQPQKQHQSQRESEAGEDRYSSDDTSEATSDQNRSIEYCYDNNRINTEQNFELYRKQEARPSRLDDTRESLCQTGSCIPRQSLSQSQTNPLYSLPRHLPPSQSYNQNLPVIMSDREERSNSGGTTSNERSPDQMLYKQGEEEREYNNLDIQQMTRSDSASMSRQDEEPRFDKFQLPSAGIRHQNANKYRNYVKSPVGEYIRSTPYTELVFDQNNQQQQTGSGSRAQSLARSQQVPDFSRVKPKVDTGRGVSPSEGYVGSNSSVIGFNQAENSLGGMTNQPRSLSRQTVIKTRRLSVDSVELASSVERSIRKYKQETKLFEELQNLKRSQIRSGKANEALLVKRLVEHFHSNSQAMADFVVVGLETYHGPYTYKAYERYLYDQLRKLSESNRGKLGKHLRQQLNDFDNEQQLRDYLQEDINAELELRRVIESSTIGSDFDQSVILEPTGALEEIRVRKKDDGERKLIEKQPSKPEVAPNNQSVDNEELRQEDERKEEITAEQLGPEATLSVSDRFEEATERLGRKGSISSSRRSSLEAELDRLKNLPLKLEEGGETSEKIANFEADILSSSIITDCLGNISRCNSPPPLLGDKEEEEDLEEEKEFENDMASIPPTPIGGRRRSVINIGNKMDVVYHDTISIEINHAPPTDPDSDSNFASDSATRMDLAGETKDDEMDPQKQVVSEVAAHDEKADEEQEGEEMRLHSRKLKKVAEADEQGEGPQQNQNLSDATTDRSVDEEISDLHSKTDESVDELKHATSGGPGNDSGLGESPGCEAARRKASSPCGELDGVTRKSSGASGRKIGSVDHEMRIESESWQQNENLKKKIFNGYDLDEMKEHFRKLREGSKVELEQLPGNVRAHSLPKTRRKPRSRLPNGKYLVNVNLKEIKERWNFIKTRERARKREQDSTSESPETFGMVNPTIRNSKSHNNLEKHEEEVEEVNGSIDRSHDKENAYILLYEINLKARDGSDAKQSTGAGLGKSREARHAGQKGRWCHKRIVKIVDVRTLKRTISLPDSLIYSNNLLKRFNILKL